MTNYFDAVAGSWDQDPMKVDRAMATAECCSQVLLDSRRHLLDFGGGTGLLSVCLSDYFEQITIADTSPAMLQMAGQKIAKAGLSHIHTQLIDADINELNDSYSAIVTLMTLHHIADTARFFAGAAELLESRGALMIADLYPDNGLFHSHNSEFDGHNGFAIEGLANDLRAAGFDVVSVQDYYTISKTIASGEKRRFPLFFLVARKR